MAMQALSVLQQHHATQGNWPALAMAARRQLVFVPWQESAHRNLMQALAAQDQRQAALDQYAKCRAILQTELGVEPALATQALANRLQQSIQISPPLAEPIARHNLPKQLKSLVGRAEDIVRLHQLVRTTPLVTLLGIGGVGKSRLAQAVGQRARHDFPDGIWFVPLANIEASKNASERIALAIAATIGFALTDLQHPLTELTTYLADQRLLLILDNWDHLTPAAEALFSYLRQTTVHVLATSRVRLWLEEEVVLQLAGLPEELAFDLFLQRAQRLLPAFRIAGTNREQIAAIQRICAEVAGLPLGIELAASWVEHFSVTEIGQSLADIVVAPTTADEHLARHQTLERVFAYSWQLLNPQQQQLLARLSIFRGGFDRAAAATVAESDFGTLSLLIAHSLVQRVSAGRYDLHPVVQEFAAQQLTAAAFQDLAGRHSRHYLAQLIATLAPTHDQDASRLRSEFENIRNAWQRAVQTGAASLIQLAVVPFADFMAQFGYLPDTYQHFTDAVQQFEPEVTPDNQEMGEFVAQLIYQQWRCSRAIHGLQRAETFLEHLLQFTNDLALKLRTYTELATTHAEGGAWERAEYYFAQIEQLALHSSDPQIYMRAIECPIHIRAIHFRGDYNAGIDRLNALLAALEQQPDSAFANEQARVQLQIQLLSSLGLVAMRYGDYGLAIRTARQGIELFSDVDRRPWRGWFLLDLALAEQFAGFYADAIAHNRAALMIAEASGAIDDIGLLKANLCLTMRPGGELITGLCYGQEAIRVLASVGLTRMEGQARNRVGHILLALERWQEADDAYVAALAVWEPLRHPNHYEAVAGRAVARYQLRDQVAALALARTVLDFVDQKGLAGVVEPVLLLLHCETVLTGCGYAKEGRAVLQRAAAWIQTIAGRISDDRVRATFLNRPDHQRLAERRIASGNGASAI
ncbi:MAG: BTAD domain-containing putative transcriptional regulator [Caldilineaceae bacterium]